MVQAKKQHYLGPVVKPRDDRNFEISVYILFQIKPCHSCEGRNRVYKIYPTLLVCVVIGARCARFGDPIPACAGMTKRGRRDDTTSLKLRGAGKKRSSPPLEEYGAAGRW